MGVKEQSGTKTSFPRPLHLADPELNALLYGGAGTTAFFLATGAFFGFARSSVVTIKVVPTWTNRAGLSDHEHHPPPSGERFALVYEY